MTEVRRPCAADRPAVERFLAAHPLTTLFLRNNLAAAGLEDGDQPYRGRWAAGFQAGEVVAVAAHFWNGNLILEAPRDLAAVVRCALTPGGRRPLAGILGPYEQAVAALAALGRAGAPRRLDSRQTLYALDLAALRAPPLLSEPDVAVRPPAAAEEDLVLAWRVAFARETRSLPDGPALKSTLRAGLARLSAAGHHWVLAQRGTPVAYSAFNAVLPDTVQVGGVYTPPARRGQGFGRAVVAGTLQFARAGGATRSVLFTDEHNHPARRAYESLGYVRVGTYGILGLA